MIPSLRVAARSAALLGGLWLFEPDCRTSPSTNEFRSWSYRFCQKIIGKFNWPAALSGLGEALESADPAPLSAG